MRVVFLIAGAGGMYCGSCLRDNRVAGTLIAKGRDVALVPLYTPIKTDEEDVSQPRVYYGGVNVYLRQKSALIRALPRWLTGVLDAPRLLRRAARSTGEMTPAEMGRLTVSILKGEHGRQSEELGKLIRGLRPLEPDLVWLPNLMFVGLAGPLKAALGSSVLCTLSGEDYFLDHLPAPARGEAFDLIERQSRDADGFVAVTEYYAAHAAEHFGLPADRVHVIPMGVEVHDSAGTADPPDRPFTIGYLARVSPEKGLHDLASAFVRLRRAERPCRLRVAGYLGPADRSYLTDIRTTLNDADLLSEFEYLGEVDRAAKREFLRSLHVLTVPAVHPEPKGLYVLEALAAGVPVVQPDRGSFPELIEATGGGLLYDPSDEQALADGIARLMDDPGLRRRLADQGRSVVCASFNSEIMAERTWQLCQQLALG
ncbi:MAG: glycosyltransferase family 4 protein [Phycisphaerae bacterium]|jgi:glycosyltransferase involved in cell wall biosynthesis